MNVKGSSQFNGNIYLEGDCKTSEHYNIYSHGYFQNEQGSGGTGIILKMCDPQGMNAPIIKWDLTHNPSIKRLHAIYQWRKNLVFCSFADNFNNDRQDIMFLNDSTNAVGIGTSEPEQKLEVKGAIKIY